jgi:cellulose synthase/poly-beta-1,6-N-acetylglucosamine synthase-like glycosyltransferase
MQNDIIPLTASIIVLSCSIVYLIAYRLMNKKLLEGDGTWPGVTLIVPMWNEEKTIADTLDSLLAMKDAYLGETEIIVIDDRSSDSSWSVVERYTRKYPFIRLCMKKGEQGKSESLNEGIRLSRYGLVGCVDADSYPSPDALAWAVKEFNDPRVGAITSMLVANRPKSIIEWFQHVEYVFSNFVLLAFESLDSMFIARGPFSLFKKDVMMEIGGFLPSHVTPTEDMEITFRIRKAGHTLRCCRRAKVFTTVMPTWKNLFWQRMRWNRGAIVNFWIHRDMFFDRKYGWFGLFVLPTSIIMIWTGIAALFHSVYSLLASMIEHHEYAEMLVTSGIRSAVAMVPEIFRSTYKAPPVLTLSISLAILAIFLLGNWLGLNASRERLNLRYILAMIGTPLFYGPLLVFFWVSALGMTAGKHGMRWR